MPRFSTHPSSHPVESHAVFLAIFNIFTHSQIGCGTVSQRTSYLALDDTVHAHVLGEGYVTTETAGQA